MAKAKKKAPTQKRKKKGGQLDAEDVKKIEENPKGAEGDELEAIFQDIEEPEIITSDDEEEDEAMHDPFLVGDEVTSVTPTVTPANEDVEDEETEDDEEEEPTQAAEDDEEEETPPSLDKATLMELVPDKFREGEDLTESLKKWHGSYGELESRQDRLEQENATNQRMLREATRPRPDTTQRPAAGKIDSQLSDAEEAALNAALADIDVLEDPISPFKKVYAMARQAAREEAKSNISMYHEMNRRQEQFNTFKAEHSNFDDLKGEMLEIVNADPHLDTPEMVDVVYNKACELRALREAKMAAKTTESVLGSDQIKNLITQVREETLREAQEAATKREAELIAKIRGGQAVRGTLSSGNTPSTTPKDRIKSGRKKVHVVRTDHGDFEIDDGEVAGILTAEDRDEHSLLNL